MGVLSISTAPPALFSCRCRLKIEAVERIQHAPIHRRVDPGWRCVGRGTRALRLPCLDLSLMRRYAALTFQLFVSEKSGIFSTDFDPSRTGVEIRIREHRRSVQPLFSPSMVQSEYASSCLAKDQSVLTTQYLPFLLGTLCRRSSSPAVA